MRSLPSIVIPCLLAGALGSCTNLELADGEGQGIVAFDTTPPAAASLLEAPIWTVGDRFEFTRGGRRQRVAFLVVAADENGYALQTDDSAHRSYYTKQLHQTGEEILDEPGSLRRHEPADASYHWPLWVGKRWACQVLRKAPGVEGIPLMLRYHCDAKETIQTPAGAFECLRIWQEMEVMLPGANSKLTSVSWYSPQVGFFVRRLESDTLWELTGYKRP